LGGRAGCRSVCQTNSSLLSECVTTRSGWPGTSRILFTCRAAAHAARTAAMLRGSFRGQP